MITFEMMGNSHSNKIQCKQREFPETYILRCLYVIMRNKHTLKTFTQKLRKAFKVQTIFRMKICARILTTIATNRLNYKHINKHNRCQWRHNKSYILINAENSLYICIFFVYLLNHLKNVLFTLKKNRQCQIISKWKWTTSARTHAKKKNNQNK